MSTLSTISHLNNQISRAPTASFAQVRGSFNAERQTPISAKSSSDSVVISAEARAKMSALDRLQVSSRVITSDQKGGNINLCA